MLNRINVVVAFEAEARPLISRLGLAVASRTGPFRVYSGDRVSLVISGMGRVAAAAATSWLGAQSGPGGVWLNTGLAGHSVLPVGEAFLAIEITDRSSKGHWYPPQVIGKSRFVPSKLTTVDIPEEGYSGESGFDMEASAFVAIARRFSTAELVQCVKVVSDNPEFPVEQPNPARATELMSAWSEELVEYISLLTDLGAELPVVGAAAESRMLEELHFTVAQQIQLKGAVRDWWAVFDKDPCSFIDDKSFESASDLIQALREKIEATVPSIHGPDGHG